MATTTDSVDLVGDEVVGNLARTALFAALMGAFAYVSFPNPLAPGIPVTLQVLGVFLAGIFLGPLWGAVAMALYLAAGAVGAPVFSGGSAGIGALLGYTAGYLWSYPIAAFAVGAVVHEGLSLRDPRTASLARLVGGMLLGTVIIYALGTVGFAVVQSVGLVEAFLVSAVAFIPFEAVKIAAAVGIVRSDAVAAE
jgi:biotin transport system substrate-specific component